jgi:hypothetical protein
VVPAARNSTGRRQGRGAESLPLALTKRQRPPRAARATATSTRSTPVAQSPSAAVPRVVRRRPRTRAEAIVVRGAAVSLQASSAIRRR